MANQNRQAKLMSLLKEQLRWRKYQILASLVGAVIMQAVLPRGFISAVVGVLL